MTRDNILFDFQWAVHGDTPADIAAVDAVSLEWGWDSAPVMRVRVANPNGRRSNFFESGDQWIFKAGRGAVDDNSTLFVGTQMAGLGPEYDEESLTLTLHGYTARLRELVIPTDANTYAGYEAMSAIKDNYDADGTMDTGGLVGPTTSVSVPRGLFGRGAGASDRLAIAQKILGLAYDHGDADRPLKMHIVEKPNGETATVTQVAEIDPTDTAPAADAALVSGTDFFRVRRQYDGERFNAAKFTGAGGVGEIYYEMDGPKIFSGSLYADYEAARSAAQAARMPRYTYELDLPALHFDLTPGAVVQVSGTVGPADGYHQVAEVRHRFESSSYGTTIRLARRPVV